MGLPVYIKLIIQQSAESTLLLDGAIITAITSLITWVITYYFTKKDSRGDLLLKKRFEIYPELFDLIQKEAISPYVGFFRHWISHERKNDLNIDLTVALNYFFPKNDFGLNDTKVFTNYFHSSKSLFISNSIEKIVEKMLHLRKDLYIILKEEISSNNYKNYDSVKYSNLQSRIRKILDSLSEQKEFLRNKMYKELNLDFFPK